MSEIITLVKIKARTAWWLILDCGHWYKWTTDSSYNRPPTTGSEFDCPNCKALPMVKK